MSGSKAIRSARTEALAAYERVRPLELAEAALIGAFESSSALLIGEHWIRWHYLENPPFRRSAGRTRGIVRGLEHLERLALRVSPAFGSRVSPLTNTT